ncbi:IclR family transcriptional regulator [Pseudonocardia phyllosphaerae]|uniref:IclR family transcriptional regulator n=1 Tax=Pseudonocardia phyllosphaerae TaxID=3390502 RepID=UPI00397A0C25
MAQQHRTVSRVLRILEAAATSEDGITLAGLATELDSPKTSVHGFVKGLVAEGYLTEGGGRYFLGPALGALMPDASATLSRYALPLMRELRDEVGETVTLAVRVGDSLVNTESVRSENVIGYSAPLQLRRPLWPTSAGKVFLSADPHARATLERMLTAGPEYPVPDLDAEVLPELATIARTGIAHNRGETVGDVSAAAVGLRRAGRLVAVLSIAGPRERLGPRLDEVGELLRARLDRAER